MPGDGDGDGDDGVFLYDVAIDDGVFLYDVDVVVKMGGGAPANEVTATTCSYRSATDGMKCKQRAAPGGPWCKNHACTRPGCSNPKSWQVDFCDEHSESSS